MEFIGILMLALGLVSANLLWRIKKDPFLTSESDRCLNRFCELDNSWNSRGLMWTRGLAVIEKNGKKQFIKQAKLCDLSLLK